MAQSGKHRRFRLKLGIYAALALVGGFGLLAWSQMVKAPAEEEAAAAPAAPEAPHPDPDPASPQRQGSARQNASGMLLLFAAASWVLSAFFIGWIVYDVYASRPAWKTQTKHPRRR